MPTLKKPKKPKKHKYRFNSHESSIEARERVLRVAKKRGSITNAQASIVGRWKQAWYHLNAMRRAGMLKKEKFNVWVPR